jgi:hypothetical protein
VLRRAAVGVGLAAALVAALAIPASADGGWGYTDCDQHPNPGCELGAGRDRAPDAGRDAPRKPDRGAPGGHGGGDRIVGDDGKLADCGYRRSDERPAQPGLAPVSLPAPPVVGTLSAQPAVFRPRSPAPVPVLAQAAAVPEPGGPGAWYVYRCTGPGTRDALYRPPIWIPDAQPGGPGPTLADLADRARNRLRLPTPTIEASPAGDQLVGVPTWLHLAPAGWRAVSATASVPGVTVVALARPRSAVWSMGDGAAVVCAGPGSPFPPGADPASASPDCGHTYRSSSAGRPGEAFAVTATVHWEVTWSGAGQTGTFPDLTTTSIAAFRVAEAHALAAETDGG